MKIYLIKKDDSSTAEIIKRIGADECCVDHLDNKTRTHVFLLKDARMEQVNIIKQTALSVGCDAAIHRFVISGKMENSDAVLMCNESQLEKIGAKLANQPFSLSKAVTQMLNIVRNELNWTVRGKNILKKRKFLIMGILNITPDSFFDGGKYTDPEKALRFAEQMIVDGADIIDIGGESTKPYSEKIDIKEEMHRVIPIVRSIRKKIPNILISVDTNKSEIANAALHEGADIINDISALTFDKNMAKTLKIFDASAVLMHIKGIPKNMQTNPEYDDLMIEITDFLNDSINIAINAGINENKIIVDPGIGFGKSIDDNFTIIENIDFLKTLKRPIMIGTSNKSFIGNTLNENIENRLEGTIASNVVSYINGVNVFRVHHVKEHIRALNIAERIKDAYI